MLFPLVFLLENWYNVRVHFKKVCVNDDKTTKIHFRYVKGVKDEKVFRNVDDGDAGSQPCRSGWSDL